MYAAAGADIDDVLVRTYTKCPTYESALVRWCAPPRARAPGVRALRRAAPRRYGSPEFAAREAASAPLRSFVASLPYMTLDTSLRAWWNVYDAFDVWRSGAARQACAWDCCRLTCCELRCRRPDAERERNSVGGHGAHPRSLMPFLCAGVTRRLQVALANWLETRKMAFELTGPLLGGPVLTDALTRMLSLSAGAPLGANRLVVVSGHYNTQLGVLSALYLDGLPSAQAVVPWLTRIPATAAVLAFELYLRDGGNGTAYAVRLVAQDGPAANYTVLPMPCASVAGAAIAGDGACMLKDLMLMTLPAVLAAGLPADWCSACNNTVAAPCVVAATTAVEAAKAADAKHHRTERVVDVAVGVGIGLGLPLAALAARLVWLRVRRRRASVAAGRSGDISLPSATAVWPHHRLDES